MTLPLALLSVIAGLAAGIFFYLASRNQRLTATPGPPRRNLALGAASSAACLAALLNIVGPASAVFLLLTLLMGVFTALPFLAALRPDQRRRR